MILTMKHQNLLKAMNYLGDHSGQTKPTVTTDYDYPENAYYFKGPKGRPKKIKEQSKREFYPFSQMTSPGMSFDVTDKEANELRGAIWYNSQKYNHKYISRTIRDEKTGDMVARVWRHI